MRTDLSGVFESLGDPPDGVHVVRFGGGDLQQAAALMLDFVERLVMKAAEPSSIFLTCVEFEADPAGFPEILTSYFGSDMWDYVHRYSVAPIVKLEPDLSYRVGRLTFETVPGQIAALLKLDAGYRRGAASRLGGIQVIDNVLRDAIVVSPFDGLAEHIADSVRLGWAASDDLDEIRIWVPEERSPWLAHTLRTL